VIFNCFFPAKHYVCTVMLPELKQRIETATEGRVKVNVPPKSLDTRRNRGARAVGHLSGTFCRQE